MIVVAQDIGINLGQTTWAIEDLLPRGYVVPEGLVAAVPVEIVANFRRLLGRDVFSEGDARSLYDYIQSRRGEMSAAFLAMLEGWLADELKHYEALRRVYSAVAGVSFAEMDRVFAQRVHELEPIAPVLVDEFTILVTLMFDEMGSVYSYRRDLWEYYRHFGGAVQRVGQHLVQDEGLHFRNAAAVLLAGHGDRLGEVAGILDQVMALEKQLGRYCKTFLLDHAQEQFRFPPQFNAVIGRMVLAQLGLGDRPSQQELQDLWQWKPDGGGMVPV